MHTRGKVTENCVHHTWREAPRTCVSRWSEAPVHTRVRVAGGHLHTCVGAAGGRVQTCGRCTCVPWAPRGSGVNPHLP